MNTKLRVNTKYVIFNSLLLLSHTTQVFTPLDTNNQCNVFMKFYKLLATRLVFSPLYYNFNVN